MQTTPAAPAASSTQLEQLKKTLGDKLGTEFDEKDVADEFQKYLDYGVPADQAVRTILRHHGVLTPASRPAAGPITQERVLLANLPPQSPFVNLKVRLLTLGTKSITARGEQKEILWGLLGDESGTAPYTSWRPLEGLQKGDVIQVEGAYTKSFNEQAQVNLGDRTKVTKLAETELPRTPSVVHDLSVGELREGQRGVRITGRVLDVAPRQVTVQGAPKTVWSGHVADATGSIEFSSWSDHNLAAGQAVTIEGGYVRGYRGVPQLSFDSDAKVTPAATAVPEADILAIRPPTLVRDLLARGGGSDIILVGSILEVKDGSGLVLRCATPGCTRVLASGMCRIHGKVDGVPDLRVKAILDDGTGSVSLVAGRELSQQLLGKDLERCKKEAQDAFRPDLIQEQLRERLVGRVFQVRGNALSDEYGMTFIARHVASFAEDAPKAAAALLGGA